MGAKRPRLGWWALLWTPPSSPLYLPSAGVQYPGGSCSTPIEPQTQGTPGQKLSRPWEVSGHKNISKVLYDRVSCPVTARGGIFETILLDIHRACGSALGWLGDIQQASWWLNREGDFLILQTTFFPMSARFWTLRFGEYGCTRDQGGGTA